MEGTVKFFNVAKGFGFVNGDDGQSYFVHISSLAPGTKLYEGDRVTFDPAEGDRGLKAENVTVGEGSAPAQEEAPVEEADKSAAEEEDQAEDVDEKENPAEEVDEEPAEESEADLEPEADPE